MIVDEAHNLVAAVNSAHSVALSAAHLAAAARLLACYLNKLQGRLGARKAAGVTKLKALAERLHAHLLHVTTVPPGEDGREVKETKYSRQPALAPRGGSDSARGLWPEHQACAGAAASAPEGQVLAVNAFLDAASLSNVNIPELLARLGEDNLLFRVASHADESAAAATAAAAPDSLRGACEAPARARDTAGAAGGSAAASAGLQLLTSFLRALTAAESHGRIIVKRGSGAGALAPRARLHQRLCDTRAARRAAHPQVCAAGRVQPVRGGRGAVPRPGPRLRDARAALAAHQPALPAAGPPAHPHFPVRPRGGGGARAGARGGRGAELAAAEADAWGARRGRNGGRVRRSAPAAVRYCSAGHGRVRAVLCVRWPPA